jgi:hypothetical protein
VLEGDRRLWDNSFQRLGPLLDALKTKQKNVDARSD